MQVTTESGQTFATGWQDRPADVWAVAEAMAKSGREPLFVNAAPHLMRATAEEENVVFWNAEKAVRGTVQPSWNQGQVGSCVGFGTTRAVQDLQYIEIASGEAEQYPGADQAKVQRCLAVANDAYEKAYGGAPWGQNGWGVLAKGNAWEKCMEGK